MEKLTLVLRPAKKTWRAPCGGAETAQCERECHAADKAGGRRGKGFRPPHQSLGPLVCSDSNLFSHLRKGTPPQSTRQPRSGSNTLKAPLEREDAPPCRQSCSRCGTETAAGGSACGRDDARSSSDASSRGSLVGRRWRFGVPLSAHPYPQPMSRKSGFVGSSNTSAQFGGGTGRW